MYLLDTMVPSDLRVRARAHPALVTWIDSVDPSSLHLSVITLLELRYGAVKKERNDPPQAAVFHNWIDRNLLPAFQGRILPVTEQIAERCARLHIPYRRPDDDSLIAATALEHDLILVTRNVRHFEGTGVTIFNPWQQG